MAHRNTVVVDSYVKIEPGNLWYVTESRRDAWLRNWANEIRDHFRDHRSMDVNGVEVVHVEEDQCSSCGHKWESMYDDGMECCAYCGEFVGEPHLSEVKELHAAY